jgi:hypothetical protein
MEKELDFMNHESIVTLKCEEQQNKERKREFAGLV